MQKTVFVEDSVEFFQRILPQPIKRFSRQIVSILNMKKAITAPLIIDSRVIGAFSVQSDRLIEANKPHIFAISNHLSAEWKKIELIKSLKISVKGTISTIASVVEARDPYTSGHQKKVSDLAVAIASEMSLAVDQVEGIRMAGIIHDLGKIQVPAEILSKPGKLTELEYQLIKTHPEVGYELLKDIDFPWPIAQIIRQHHERMDGSGYPQGLKGDEIMLEARILCVADIIEAMSSHRPYRPALGIEKALKQIRKDKGTLLDPDVVDACLKVFKKGYQLPEG